MVFSSRRPLLKLLFLFLPVFSPALAGSTSSPQAANSDPDFAPATQWVQAFYKDYLAHFSEPNFQRIAGSLTPEFFSCLTAVETAPAELIYDNEDGELGPFVIDSDPLVQAQDAWPEEKVKVTEITRTDKGDLKARVEIHGNGNEVTRLGLVLAKAGSSWRIRDILIPGKKGEESFMGRFGSAPEYLSAGRWLRTFYKDYFKARMAPGKDPLPSLEGKIDPELYVRLAKGGMPSGPDPLTGEKTLPDDVYVPDFKPVQNGEVKLEAEFRWKSNPRVSHVTALLSPSGNDWRLEDIAYAGLGKDSKDTLRNQLK